MHVTPVVLAATIAAATGLSTASVKADVIDQLIFSNCESAMRSEYEQAQAELIEDDLNTTCSCVVEQIRSSFSINQAKTACIKTEDVAVSTSDTGKEI